MLVHSCTMSIKKVRECGMSLDQSSLLELLLRSLHGMVLRYLAVLRRFFSVSTPQSDNDHIQRGRAHRSSGRRDSVSDLSDAVSGTSSTSTLVYGFG